MAESIDNADLFASGAMEDVGFGVQAPFPEQPDDHLVRPQKGDQIFDQPRA
jgi:hypothetical protein